MQTWLDWFLYRYADELRQNLSEQGHAFRAIANDYISKYTQESTIHTSDYHLGKAAIDLAFTNITSMDIDAIRKSEKLSQQEAGLVIATYQFIHPEVYSAHTRAIKVSPELIDVFMDSVSPTVSHEELGIIEDTVSYLDFPLSKVKLYGDMSIKAVVIAKTGQQQPVIICVLSEGHKLSASWVISFNYDTDTQSFTYNLPIPLLNSMDDTELTSLLSNMKTKIINIIQLVLLYHKVASARHVEPLPYLDDKHVNALKNVKKFKAKQKTHSVFSVSTLTPPADRFGRREYASVDSTWHLSHKIKVRGHFRWQAHGKGRAERKLIWIDQFEKGAGENKPVMDLI